ncbi:MAG: DNA polymerase III subunit delta [Candidatus Wildermuthbacteria bacterium]|nr:DNA polymerase III subunit delta [Candidatus Wildermuthbacteria bacterium]
MIILIAGPDTYRSRQKIRAIIKRYHQLYPSGFYMHQWNGPEIDGEELRRELFTPSMFQEKKLFLFFNCFASPVLQEFVMNLKEDMLKGKGIVLIFFDENAPVSAPFRKFLERLAAFAQEFPFLKGAQLNQWIRKRFQAYGIAGISASLIAQLQQEIGGDLWRMEQEIRKLAAFLRAPRQKESNSDLKLLLPFSIETDAFRIIDCIVKSKSKEGLALLRAYEAQGVSPFPLFSLLGSQIRKMLEIKEMQQNKKPYEEIQKKMALHPYAFKTLYGMAQNIEFGKIKDLYKKIFAIDTNVKTGTRELEESLELLAVGFERIK